jgi:sec-independent protein translocase protein TatA
MFGRFNPLEIIIIVAVILILFGGRGKISAMMSDMAKGIKSFRKGLKENNETDTSQTTSGALMNEPIDVTPDKDKSKA